MIGIVVVSHSHALARAAVDLAREMAETPPPIAIAAGLDEHTFGTDAMAISEALAEVDSPDGVLVLLDLGSALLSTEMALEFVDPDLAERVRVSPAPLVEGLVAAVVTAASGAPLEEVAAEAARGADAKQSHMGTAPQAGDQPDEGGPASPTAPTATDADAARARATIWRHIIENEHGLHARPAAALVGALRGLDVQAGARNASTGAGPVDAASLSGLALLGLRRGHDLVIELTGPAAEAAVGALDRLAGERFGESVNADASPAGARKPDAGGAATAASSGGGGPQRRPGSGTQIVFAPAHVRGLEVDVSGYVPGDDEAQRLDDARDELVRQSFAQGDEMLRLQGALLTDPDLVGQLNAHLDAGESAVQAVDAVFTAAADRFAALDDPYQAERAQDLRSLRRQLLNSLVGKPEQQQPDGEHVLVVPELDAATAGALDPAVCLGVITTTGGASGHGVLIATGRGIPVLTGQRDAAAVRSGQQMALDPVEGRWWADPDETTREQLLARHQERQQAEQQALALAHAPALTQAGVEVRVEANIGSVDDAVRAAEAGAEGSGLVRTEMLFARAREAPSAEQQAEMFVRIGRLLAPHPITVRTWDVGGDKPLPFLPQQRELNPFLGERGLRTMRRVPELFVEQLRGIALASREVPVRVKFPMVTEPEEMAWAREQMLSVIAEVGVNPVPIGMMVEVPAAALRAAEFVGLADFVSIGTNDLTQYTTAADRGNGVVSHLARLDSPAVLSLMRMTCEQMPGVPVAVCGDLASRPDMVGTLIDMGVRELSCRPPLVPHIKQAVRGCA